MNILMKIMYTKKIKIIIYFQPQLQLPDIKNKIILPTKAEIMAYIEQFENARIKVQESRKCISCPENILVCILILMLVELHIFIISLIQIN